MLKGRTLGIAAIIMLVVISAAHDARGQLHGGPVASSVCITPQEYAEVRAAILRSRPQLSIQGVVVSFADPMGDGGMNSFGKPVYNYVDLQPGPNPFSATVLAIMGENHPKKVLALADPAELPEAAPPQPDPEYIAEEQVPF